MELRKLKSRDMFKLSRIIKLMGLSKLIKLPNTEGMTEEEKNAESKSFGVSLLFTVLENIYLAEKEIIDLLADLTGTSVKEVEELSFKELKDLITQLFKDESFINFF